jgi:HK97 family phage prohead protease
MSDMETRAAGGEIRAVSESDRTFELRIVAFNTVDSYGSVWEPGVFADSLRTKLPPACWGHDWARVIGSVKEHDERSDGHYGLVQMADMDSVPDARMAYSLIRDGHITDTSFGFKRGEWNDSKRSEDYKPALDGEKERMIRARLDEVSPVLVGAVPGSRILTVRSEEKISRMDAGQLLTGVATGQVTLRDALNALEDPESLRAQQHKFAGAEDGVCTKCGETKTGNLHTKWTNSREEEREEIEITEADAELALTLMALDDGNRAAGTVAHPGSAAQLKEYWAHGKGALKIRWGTAGDHTRCVHFLSKYVGPEVVHGLCTNIQQLAIGHAGNKTPAEKGL